MVKLSWMQIMVMATVLMMVAGCGGPRIKTDPYHKVQHCKKIAVKNPEDPFALHALNLMVERGYERTDITSNADAILDFTYRIRQNHHTYEVMPSRTTRTWKGGWAPVRVNRNTYAFIPVATVHTQHHEAVTNTVPDGYTLSIRLKIKSATLGKDLWVGDFESYVASKVKDTHIQELIGEAFTNVPPPGGPKPEDNRPVTERMLSKDIKVLRQALPQHLLYITTASEPTEYESYALQGLKKRGYVKQTKDPNRFGLLSIDITEKRGTYDMTFRVKHPERERIRYFTGRVEVEKSNVKDPVQEVIDYLLNAYPRHVPVETVSYSPSTYPRIAPDSPVIKALAGKYKMSSASRFEYVDVTFAVGPVDYDEEKVTKLYENLIIRPKIESGEDGGAVIVLESKWFPKGHGTGKQNPYAQSIGTAANGTIRVPLFLRNPTRLQRQLGTKPTAVTQTVHDAEWLGTFSVSVTKKGVSMHRYDPNRHYWFEFIEFEPVWY